VMKAMAKNPANRYQTATEMAEDLHRVQEGEPVLATPILPGQTTQVVSRPVRHTEAMPVLPEEEIRGRRRWPIILTTLLILGLVGVAAFLLVRELDGGPPTVEVPNVVGLRAEAARNRLQADGFRVVVTRDVSDQPQGRVFRQIPDQGELVEEGSEVEIFVSSGPEPVVVPELIGKTIEDARLELQTAGLSLGGIREQPSDEFDEGQIIRQNPEAGDEVNPEAEVDVVVSSGRLTAFVPNVRCQTLADARAAITDQGLKFRVVGEEPSTVCETGTVASTDPEGGTEVPVGTTVDVFVAFESLPSPSPSPTTPTLPPSPTPT